MKLLGIIAVLILLVGLILTLALSGKGDKDYHSATKRNVTNLTLIYVALGVICIGIVAFLIT
ncbi:hypothetical protein [Bacillus sp. FJAT-47783]|uniref:hypothetical protein n=1 Tax=Bacillus sp. FJAT-47783 TaxID=2922712 RepID=UPI001FABAB81|nr:hypothetical protein [Bacillus sp. FJAT-47783]